LPASKSHVEQQAAGVRRSDCCERIAHACGLWFNRLKLLLCHGKLLAKPVSTAKSGCGRNFGNLPLVSGEDFIGEVLFIETQAVICQALSEIDRLD
jgi:hypothetical protein